MGVLLFLVKTVLKVAKPFLKQAIYESLVEAVSEFFAEKLAENELPIHEFETIPLPDIPTTEFDLL